MAALDTGPPSRFGPQCVPRLQIERANDRRDGQVARQLATEDEFNHIRLVSEATKR